MKKFNIAFFNLLSSTFIISFLLSNYVAKASTVNEVTYRSSTMGQNRQMMVYLPDGYDESKTYPTFYLVHGGGQDHRAWTVEGDAKGIIDRSIASGKSVPMIVVMPNVKDFAMDVFTKELCNDIIPYIESNYKAIAHKDRRALAGLSWGGLHALDAGLYRYDLFGYLGVYSSGWFLGDNIYNVMDQYLSEKGAEIEASMNYFYFGEGGRDDIAYENGMETMKLLRKHGLTVNYFEHSGSHSFVAWKQDLDAFLPFLFKDVNGFLFFVARNLWINRVKKRNRQTNISLIPMPLDDKDPLAIVISDEKREVIDQFLGKLGDRCQQILKYVIFDGMSMKEIAKLMNFAGETVAKSTHYRCKKKLMELVEKDQSVIKLFEE